MTRIASTLAAAVALTLLSPRPGVATYYTGTGSTSSFRSQTGVLLGTVIAPNILTTRVSNVSAGQVLTIEISVSNYAAPADLGIYALVYTNAGFVEPSHVAAQYCEAGGGCVLTNTYWMDIDKAVADGNAFYGQSITVELQVSEISSTPAGAVVNISLRSRLEKKN